MAEHNKLGTKGEDLAVDYLLGKGYEILNRNWIGERHEIDIIARDSDLLVFVEVKTRSSTFWGNPEDAVSATKIKRMVAAADYYLYLNDSDTSVRFDVITVVTNKKQTEIEHIEDAFLPPLN